MARKKDPPKKKVGPSDTHADEAEPKQKSPRELAEELKRRLETDGVAGVLQGLAPLLEKVHKAATEAGNAAAVAGATAVGRAKDALAHTACVACGTRLPTTAKFCLECGATVPKEKKCGKCGTALTGPTKFCPECGTKS